MMKFRVDLVWSGYTERNFRLEKGIILYKKTPVLLGKKDESKINNNGPSGTRTQDRPVMSRML